MTTRTVRVLLVEDSKVAAAAAKKIIDAEPGLQLIGVAADPFVAASIIARKVPDVMVLDIELPRMNGITFLRKVMRQHPIKTVVWTGTATGANERAVQALQAGAVAVVDKMALRRTNGERILIDAIRLAAKSKVVSRARDRRPPSIQPAIYHADLVAVGASTGGTDAVTRFIRRLPRATPGVVIVQHLMATFSEPFVKGLSAAAPHLEVAMANHNDVVEPGKVLVAPGGQQTYVRRLNGKLTIRIGSSVPIKRHCPSVEALFSSAAEHVGARAIGVLLTGMGDDGADGLLAMREKGAFTVVQDEATSVVWGMPKAAADLGAAAKVLPLDQIADAVCKAAFQGQERRRRA